jgi:transposase
LKGGTILEKRSQRRFTAEEKLQILQEGEYGNMSINEVCRRHGISTVTYYYWRKQSQTAMKEGLGGKTKRQKSRREIELEEENRRLKHTIVEITQENVELKKKNFR